MAYSLPNRFQEDILSTLESSTDLDLDQEELQEAIEELVETHIDIDDPEAGRIYNMAGRVMDAERREPITVTLDIPTGAAITSTAISALAGLDMVAVGTALLAIYSAVAQGRVTKVEPDVALTYAVGWDMSEAGKTTVGRDELERRVISESEDHPEKVDMDEKDVEDAIWKLRQMKCISGEKNLHFRERCTVQYK